MTMEDFHKGYSFIEKQARKLLVCNGCEYLAIRESPAITCNIFGENNHTTRTDYLCTASEKIIILSRFRNIVWPPEDMTSLSEIRQSKCPIVQKMQNTKDQTNENDS